MREFCEFRNLLPRGLKLAPEDIWERIAFVLSMKMQEPQFSGQTKERLSSREAAAFVSGVVRMPSASGSMPTRSWACNWQSWQSAMPGVD